MTSAQLKLIQLMKKYAIADMKLSEGIFHYLNHFTSFCKKKKKKSLTQIALKAETIDLFWTIQSVWTLLFCIYMSSN